MIKHTQVDVVVIGAGAAGLFCAATAGQRGRSVVVLEHAEKPGKKILISGGGRCNFTNIGTTPANFLSQNPHFCRSALARFTQHDFIALVEQFGIEYYEKTLGQLFCVQSSRQIVNMLIEMCYSAKAQVKCNTSVQTIHHNTTFIIDAGDETFECESVVIATGGMSIPKMGATDFGYRIAQQFNIPIVPTKPGLVPLTLQAGNKFQALAGVSVPVMVESAGVNFTESMLFTHKGISGPALLQISSYLSPGQAVNITFRPDLHWDNVLTEAIDSNASVTTVLSDFIPRRLAEVFTAELPPTTKVKQLTKQERALLLDQLTQTEIAPSGTEGFAKAEVTVGGVDTTALSSKTFESATIKGLYFIGEVLDVTGHLGGYNFQWAWSSGWCCGQYC